MVVSDADQFRAKYGSQKAGFDSSDQLVLIWSLYSSVLILYLTLKSNTNINFNQNLS